MSNGRKVKWYKKLKGEIASLVKSQVSKQVDADKQEKSELSEVASILLAMNRPTDPRIAAKSGASNDDMAMATAVSINKIIQRKRDNP